MVTIHYRDGSEERVFNGPDGSKPTVRTVNTATGTVSEYIIASADRTRELRIPASAVNCIDSFVGEA